MMISPKESMYNSKKSTYKKIRQEEMIKNIETKIVKEMKMICKKSSSVLHWEVLLAQWLYHHRKWKWPSNLKSKMRLCFILHLCSCMNPSLF